MVRNQPSAEKEQANSHARDFTEADIADGQAGRFGWVEAPRLSAAASGKVLAALFNGHHAAGQVLLA